MTTWEDKCSSILLKLFWHNYSVKIWLAICELTGQVCTHVIHEFWQRNARFNNYELWEARLETL